MDKDISLSKAQWNILQSAYERGTYGVKNKISMSYISNRTLKILVDKEMILQDLDIRDPQERDEIQKMIQTCINNAKIALEKDEWFGAYEDLKHAWHHHNRLEKRCWWLSPKAIALFSKEG